MNTIAIEKTDWARVAAPQADGYDTRIVLQCAEKAGKSVEASPYTGSLIDGFLSVKPLAFPNEVSMWCGQGPLEHPNIPRALNLLKCWQEGFEQFKKLVNTIYPIQNVKISSAAFPNSGAHSSKIVLGSSSHSEWKRFGSLYCTLTDPIGTAQAFVHEMAHQKLRALGIHVEKSYRFIRNSPDELFESPVRKDKLRPMTAIVHATYSWIYIVQLNVRMLAAQKQNNSEDIVINLFNQYLKRNIMPLVNGMETIHANISLDAEGESFFAGLYEWYNEILSEAGSLYHHS